MHEITALPVVVPLAVLVLVATLGWLRRRSALTTGRCALAVVTCVYGAGVVANTLLPVYVGGDASRSSWRVFINLTLLANTDPSDMAKNIVLFLPLGLLLPLVGRVDSLLRVLGYGFGICLVMEALQFVNAIAWHGGHVADINDLLSDTVGVLIGYGVFTVLRRVPVIGRLAATAAFPPGRRRG